LPRAAYEATSYQEAAASARQLSGRSLSQQSFGLREKILEAEATAVEDPRIIEVHPEVSFRALAGKPLTHSKTSWTGVMIRRALLAAAGIMLPTELPKSNRGHEGGRGDAAGPGSAAPDDVLDAAAAAWTAQRKAKGEALRFPSAVGCKASEGVIWY